MHESPFSQSMALIEIIFLPLLLSGYGPPQPGQGFPPTSHTGGYPPGNQGFAGGQPNRPGMQPGPAMQPPQQRRLDPDQMPSPVSIV